MIDINELRQSLGAIRPEEVAELLDRLEAAEKDLIVKEEVIDSLAAVVKKLDAQCDATEKERGTLRAKIEEMERQKPVATIHINSITGNPGVDFIPGHQYLNHNSSLYALPGAQKEKRNETQ